MKESEHGICEFENPASSVPQQGMFDRCMDCFQQTVSGFGHSSYFVVFKFEND